jgi:thiamine-monophosphate kinase
MMVEGIHFDLTYTPLKHLGYKAVATNVSDIAAMNGIAKQITVSLALSNRFSVEAIEELYTGIRAACENYKVDLVGGDTTSSPKGLIISVTVMGTAEAEKIVYRNKAQKGDIICVTGDLGAAFVGLQVLRREKEEFKVNPNMQPKLDDKEYVVARQLKPEARVDVIYELKEHDILPTAMIDISDGLASEILHICKQSQVGAVILEKNLPIEKNTIEVIAELNMNATVAMLNGGEDYELLFTIKQSDFDKIKNIPEITTIGYITDAENGVYLLSNGGQKVEITAQGWVHF